MNVATADTMIACWDAKYHYSFWRPNHAIQRAETDGNPARRPTRPGCRWLSATIRSTLRSPCFTSSVTESLRQYFGTKKVKLVITSLAPGAGPTRTYENLDDLVADVWNARVWGGLHYRSTVEQTSKDFPRIARDVGKRYLLDDLKKHDEGGPLFGG